MRQPHCGYVGHRSMGHPEHHDDDLVEPGRCRSCDMRLSQDEIDDGEEWCEECLDAEEDRHE